MVDENVLPSTYNRSNLVSKKEVSMKSNWKIESLTNSIKEGKLVTIALALGIALGFAGGQAVLSTNSSTEKTETKTEKVPVRAAEHSLEKCPYHKSIGFTFSLDPWSRRLVRDSFFNDFDTLADMPVSLGREWSTSGISPCPGVDISETANEIRVSADVPGLESKDLDVSVSDSSITIKGEKKRESSDKDAKKSERSERFFGMFERSLSLPCRVESEKADASLKNGVLTIVVPKSQLAQKDSKKLSIKTQ